MQFKKRLQRLEERFVVPEKPVSVVDTEYEAICGQDPEAAALHAQANAIIQEAVKHHPDAGALYANQARLYASMDTPSLERLRDCVVALHARVDLLRKRPR